MKIDTYFNNACSVLDHDIKNILLSLTDAIKTETEEIALQKYRPLYLVTSAGIRFVNHSGELMITCNEKAVTVDAKCLENAIMRACGYTVFAHQKELESGYISFSAGCRLAITGSHCSPSGAVTDWKTIDSISIRIARNIRLSVHKIFKDQGNICSTLIVGPPASGKTTWLRSIVYALANGEFGRYYRVSVIDERNEIFPSGIERPPALQVLTGTSKADGISRAVRLCAPDIIVCDEIGAIAEAERMGDSVLSGVVFICSMHASDAFELQQKDVYKMLIKKNVFRQTVILRGKNEPGVVQKILEKDCSQCELSLLAH